MSVLPSSPGRAERFVEALPILSALALHATAHDRWALAAPLMMGLLAVVFARWVWGYSAGRLLLAGALGLGAGALLLVVGEAPPDSALPPQVLSPLCGLLAGLASFSFVAQRRTYAWIYAALLAVLSLQVQPTWPLLIALMALVLSVLAVAFAQGGLARVGWRGAVGFGAFVLMLGGLTLGLMRAIRASEGVLMNAVFKYIGEREPDPGLGLKQELSLSAMSKLRGGKRILFELSGERPRRLRTVVYDQFDGIRWRTSAALDRTVLELSKLPAPAASRTTELMVVSPVGTILPAPAGTRAVEGVFPRVLGGWVMRAGKLEGLAITLRGDAAERLPPEPPPDAALTAVPPELAVELEPFARELTEGARTPREMAEKLEAHFQTNHLYSLDVNLSGKGHALAILIREKRPAYCTYFASAMAALLRLRGVPARVVGGFAPEEENPLTHATLVRERDAHAWVEVYLADEGRFVPFDPTPWRSRDAALGMDEDKPGFVGNVLGAVTSFFRRMLAAFWSDPSGYLWSLVKSPFFFGPLVALAAWRIFGARRERRAKGPRQAMLGADPAARAAYGKYLRALEKRAGLVPAPTETDDELLERLKTARGESAARIAAEFIAGYRQVRYRGVPAAEPLDALLSKLDSALQRPEPR